MTAVSSSVTVSDAAWACVQKDFTWSKGLDSEQDFDGYKKDLIWCSSGVTLVSVMCNQRLLYVT